MKFLIIEDDTAAFEVASISLKAQWPDAAIMHAPLGELGVQLARAEEPDMIILDIGLPDIDGFQVCTHIRGNSDVPIVILTVRDTTEDIIKGLELGADDFVTKPFSPQELVARVNAIFRRIEMTHLRDEDVVFHQGKLIIHFKRGEARANSEPIKLSPTEYQLFYYLVSNVGRVVASQSLLGEIWGEGYRDKPYFLTSSIVKLKATLQQNAPTQSLTLREDPGGYSIAVVEGRINE